MSEKLTYDDLFKTVFNVEDSDLNSDFVAAKIAKWDSITHLELITAIEDEFDIMLDTEDILEFNSYEAGKQVLKKYNVEL